MADINDIDLNEVREQLKCYLDEYRNVPPYIWLQIHNKWLDEHDHAMCFNIMQIIRALLMSEYTSALDHYYANNPIDDDHYSYWNTED